MAESICPACGKPNPQDLERCIFCNANLSSEEVSPDGNSIPAPGSGVDIPDWLREIGSQESAAGSGSQAGREADDFKGGDESSDFRVEQTPDWLASIRSKVESPAEEDNLAAESPEPDAFVSPEEEPEWLVRLRARREAQQYQGEEAGVQEGPQAGSTPEPVSGEGIPNWLAMLSSEAAAGDDVSGGETKNRSTPAAGANIDIPDWLTELPGSMPGKSKEQTGAQEKFAGSGMFDNISQPSIETPEGEETVSQSPFIPTGSPDWMGRLPATDTTGEHGGGSTAHTSSENLLPADLPDWVKAMRPDQAHLAPSSTGADSKVERAGPLAGLAGIVPAEPAVAQFRKPPVYSAKLQISDKDQRRAELLRHQIQTEEQVSVSYAARIISPNQLVRWISGTLLILVLLYSIITGANLTSPPAPAQDIKDIYQLIDQLTADSPVLLAYDYEPAYSGEIEAASTGITAHILGKGATIATISTLTSGPALSRHALNRVLGNDGNLINDFFTSDKYADLGYLPGGSIALVNFAQNPRLVIPYYDYESLDKYNPWKKTSLIGVNKASDFSLVLVMTDNLETAQAWIEQVGVTLDETPMIMIASTQAYPLLQPYRASGQIKGVVNGIAGGVAYEQLKSSPGIASYYWNPFVMGLSFTIFMILVAVVFNIGVSVIGGRKRKGAVQS